MWFHFDPLFIKIRQTQYINSQSKQQQNHTKYIKQTACVIVKCLYQLCVAVHGMEQHNFSSFQLTESVHLHICLMFFLFSPSSLFICAQPQAESGVPQYYSKLCHPHMGLIANQHQLSLQSTHLHQHN